MADIIVAGNTSGAITISAPLVAGSGVLTLPTGTDTLIGKATTDTLTNKTLGAGTVFPAGAVLQVVNATFSGQTSSSTNVFADTGLTISITPTSATSKVLVIVDISGCYKTTNNTMLQLRLLRNSTTILTMEGGIGYTGTTTTNAVGSSSANYLDSPATTSATTYKVQQASGNNNVGAGINFFNLSAAETNSTITLMEIAG